MFVMTGFTSPSSILVNLKAFLPRLIAARTFSATGATLELRIPAPISDILNMALRLEQQYLPTLEISVTRAVSPNHH